MVKTKACYCGFCLLLVCYSSCYVLLFNTWVVFYLLSYPFPSFPFTSFYHFTSFLPGQFFNFFLPTFCAISELFVAFCLYHKHTMLLVVHIIMVLTMQLDQSDTSLSKTGMLYRCHSINYAFTRC